MQDDMQTQTDSLQRGGSRTLSPRLLSAVACILHDLESARVTRRQKAIAFFVALCVLLVAAAVSLNIGWILVNAGASRRSSSASSCSP